ncbi:hypothetical protein ACJMK2_042749 [Sinanodonta woodiana]|uniref:Uncharacterized protein n=1 Tax=Sinanodonta woodiana TaxID=1069815 RepID=A0ABD3W8B9_SINWO
MRHSSSCQTDYRESEEESAQNIGRGFCPAMLMWCHRMATSIVMKVQKADSKHGGTGLNREDVMIVIGACLMVLSMHFWYRLAGNVSTIELLARDNTRNRISIPSSDLDMTVTLV